MRETVRFGKVAGISVGAHWSVLVVLLLVAEGMAMVVLPELVPGHSPVAYWLAGLLAALIFLGSLLAHELAHALVARTYGLPVQRITLWMLGGVSLLGGEPPTPRADLRVALAGPLASVAVAVGSAVLAMAGQVLGAPDLAVATAAWLATMNAVLAVFNLLPGAPLDGGRVLRAFLWRRFGDRDRAEIAAARSGRFLGYLLGFVGLLEVFAGDATGLWLILLGYFLVMAATAEGMAASTRSVLAGETVEAAMQPDPVVGYDWMTIDQFVAQVAGHSRQLVFPVVDADRRPTGAVTLRSLSEIQQHLRASTRLAAVQEPVATLSVVGPQEPLADLVARLPTERDAVALVVDAERLVGVVTAADATRALHLASLRRGRSSSLR